MGLKKKNLSNGQAPLSAINMTPFIDVMLVLIIIFIVTFPILQHAVKITLPKEARVQLKITDPVQIKINAQNQIVWQGQVVTLNEFAKRSTRLNEQFSDSVLIIEASPQANYEIVAQVLANSKRSGLNKINLITP